MPWGGHPQGAPLPFVFSRRYALGTRGAPTRGAPTDMSSSLGVMPCVRGAPMPWGGHPQGAPLPIVFSALCPEEGTHKGRPYRLSSLGVMPWGGRPQGAPLPIVFSRRYALGRAPTRGAPTTDCLLSALGAALGGPRGAPTDCLLSALWGAHKGRPYRLSSLPWGGCPGEGTHKGRPYRLSSLGVMAGGGHPQGAPLPIVFSRRYGLGRAPTRGAPTDCLLSALWPGEGTHKGRPYRLSSLGVMPTHKGRPCLL